MGAVEANGQGQEIVELLRGAAVILMSIDSKLERLLELLGGDDAEEDQP